MQVGSEQWRQLIISGAAQLDIAVTTAQAQAFARHARELIHWNRKINLTAIVDPRQLAIKHFLDAIAPLAWIPDKGALIDVGTGGGFPGIALSIMRPHQPMTLIDGSRKKISFVKHLIRLLVLENVQALQTRVEVLSRQETNKGRFQTVVCRAFADPSAVVRMTKDLLAPQGKILVYQGPNTNLDFTPEDFDKDCKSEVIEYRLPFSEDPRKLVIFQFEDN
jgi:16S rRNA (guanine527-N7)-methyltransferase